VTFFERPTVTERDLILPDGLRDRVRSHVLGIAAQRDRLRVHGQHLKRGVLLYGPPGTGKTHTMRYLLSASPRPPQVVTTRPCEQGLFFASYRRKCVEVVLD